MSHPVNDLHLEECRQMIEESEANRWLSDHALIDMAVQLEEAIKVLPWDSDALIRSQVTLTTWRVEVQRARERVRAGTARSESGTQKRGSRGRRVSGGEGGKVVRCEG